jgi:hypothetical protein
MYEYFHIQFVLAGIVGCCERLLEFGGRSKNTVNHNRLSGHGQTV